MPASAESVPSMVETPSMVMPPPGSTDRTAPLGMSIWLAPFMVIVWKPSADSRSEKTGRRPLVRVGDQAVDLVMSSVDRPKGSLPAADCASSSTWAPPAVSVPVKVRFSVPPVAMASVPAAWRAPVNVVTMSWPWRMGATEVIDSVPALAPSV